MHLLLYICKQYICNRLLRIRFVMEYVIEFMYLIHTYRKHIPAWVFWVEGSTNKHS